MELQLALLLVLHIQENAILIPTIHVSSFKLWPYVTNCTIKQMSIKGKHQLCVPEENYRIQLRFKNIRNLRKVTSVQKDSSRIYCSVVADTGCSLHSKSMQQPRAFSPCRPYSTALRKYPFYTTLITLEMIIQSKAHNRGPCAL